LQENLNYTLLENDSGIQNLAEIINRNNITEIAVDFEGESNLHRYGIHLCLIQLIADGRVFLIDPIKIPDLSILEKLLENREILKIMFSAEFDIKLLKHTKNIQIKNIFDLQVGFKMLGYEKLGLENIASEVMGINKYELVKKQKSDWNKRPLSEAQLNYAINDVIYLFEMKQILDERLNPDQKLRCKNICIDMEKLQIEKRREPHLSIKGSGNLNYREKIFLKHLFSAREKIAQKIDFPPFWVMGNKELLYLAQQQKFSEGLILNNFNLPKRAVPMIKDFHEAFLKSVEELKQKKIEV
jgi:ribonuclease D